MKPFDDKTFLQAPEEWPGGVCCVKRRNLEELPLSEAMRDGCGQFTTTGSNGGPAVIVIDLNSMKKVREEEYATLDALLVDWMVD